MAAFVGLVRLSVAGRRDRRPLAVDGGRRPEGTSGRRNFEWGAIFSLLPFARAAPPDEQKQLVEGKPPQRQDARVERPSSEREDPMADTFATPEEVPSSAPPRAFRFPEETEDNIPSGAPPPEDGEQSDDHQPKEEAEPRRKLRSVSSALEDVNHRAYGGLYESYVHEILTEAHDRRVKSGVPTVDLATVIPYDLQKELFEEFDKVQASRSAEPQNDARGGQVGTTAVVAISATDLHGQRAVPLNQEAFVEENKPWWLWPVRVVAGRFGARGDRDSLASDEASVSDEILIPEGEASTSTDNGSENALDMTSVIHRASQVSSPETAREFVETVGVRSLVVAARVSPGESASKAMAALSEIASLMPSSRLDIVRADNGSILSTLMSMLGDPPGLFDFVKGPRAPDNGFMIQGRISAAHLVGYLGLIPGAAGAVEREQLASNARLVASLQHLSGGLSSGQPEGCARAARRALAILGVNKWVARMPGQRGLRVLSIDGGGTRALMTFEMLKYLKKITGCEVHEMFDVIGGTSTGAIIAGALGILKKPVEEVEEVYAELVAQIFAKHPLNTSKMVFTRAYYDSALFEQLLQRECGSVRLLDSTAGGSGPKVFAVSAVLTPQKAVVAHVFRNYTYPVSAESRYKGSVDVPLWLALRCSSAAPTFFSEMRVNGEVHADGAIVANNPSAVALHEAHSAYPGVPVEVLVSCGNGIQTSAGVESLARQGEKNPAVGWTELLGSIITSATSTEQAHHALEDLMPADKYFRFNPPTNCTNIDETEPGRLAFWVREARAYIESEQERFEQLARILRPKVPATPLDRLRDSLVEELDYLRYEADSDATNGQP